MTHEYELINLDDENERDAFLQEHGNDSARRVAKRLYLKGPGSVIAAGRLQAYAWNARTAANCRLKGAINAAERYEGIMESIYKRLPPSMRW